MLNEVNIDFRILGLPHSVVKQAQETDRDPFFVHGVVCLVKPVNARFLSLVSSVKYDSSLISFSGPWQVNSFFEYLRINNLFSYSFHFFDFAVTVSKFSESFSCGATVFFCRN